MFGTTDFERCVKNLKNEAQLVVFIHDFSKMSFPDVNGNIEDFFKQQSYDNTIVADGLCWIVTGNLYALTDGTLKLLHSIDEMLSTNGDTYVVKLWAQGMIDETFVQIYLGEKQVSGMETHSPNKVTLTLK